jgi:hypothetical protein
MYTAQRHRRFLDRQQRSPRSHPFTSFFGQEFRCHPLPKPRYKPQRVRLKPVPFGGATWQVPSIAARCGHRSRSRSTTPLPLLRSRRLRPELPNTGSIACLLLQSIGTQGTNRRRVLANTTFVQRLNAKDLPPATPTVAAPLPMWASNGWCHTPPTTTSSRDQ